MLKTTWLSKEFVLKKFRVENNQVVYINGKVNEMINNLSKFKNLKNKKHRNSIYVQNIKAIGKLIFLTPNTKKAFNNFQQVFIKASILWYFDSKCHI